MTKEELKKLIEEYSSDSKEVAKSVSLKILSIVTYFLKKKISIYDKYDLIYDGDDTCDIIYYLSSHPLYIPKIDNVNEEDITLLGFYFGELTLKWNEILDFDEKEFDEEMKNKKIKQIDEYIENYEHQINSLNNELFKLKVEKKRLNQLK